MTNESLFSFEEFYRQHEGPLFEFVLARLGRNGHVSGHGPADTNVIAPEHPSNPSDPSSPSEALQDAAADITVEVFVQLYRQCSRENLLDGDKTITDTTRDSMRDGLYKSAAWLCDGP